MLWSAGRPKAPATSTTFETPVTVTFVTRRCLASFRPGSEVKFTSHDPTPTSADDVAVLMRTALHTVADLCAELAVAESKTVLREALRHATGAFGASFFVFGMRTGSHLGPPAQVAISSYPKAWQRRYDDTNAFGFDPVVAKGLAFGPPFRWDGLYDESNPKHMALRLECLRRGMSYGVTCTERGAYGAIALLSICGPRPIATEAGQWELLSPAMTLLLSSLHKAVDRLTESARARRGELSQALTATERRCLELMARGHTAEEVAQGLGLKPRTIRYHVNQVVHRWGLNTVREAIVKAITDGAIDLTPLTDVKFSTVELYDAGPVFR